MKKTKLFIGVLLILTSFSLASCDMLNENSVTKTSRISNTTTSRVSNTTTTSANTTTKYTVRFNSNGGTSISSQKVEYGESVTKPTDPRKSGYTFLSWYSDEDCINLYDFQSIVTNNITLYAKWSIESYTISFNVKGGNETIDDQIVEYNNTLTKPDDPTKDGYTFAGWYTSSSYSTQYDFANKVTRSFTLYAKWDEIPKTVEYEIGEPIIDFWTNSISSKWMKIIVPITNTGTADLYLGDISVDIESSTGTLLDTRSMIDCYPECIKPGETAYYYKETTANFTDTDVRVVPHIEPEKSVNPVLRYTISDVTITTDQYNGVKVMGRVENTTTKKGFFDKIAAYLFDANGKLICVAYTYLENDLAVGAKVGFSLTPYAYRDFTPEDVASYEIYGYPKQYNW